MHWIKFAAFSLVGLLFIDAGLHQLQSSRVQYDYRDASNEKARDTLVVYFPGILTDGVSSSSELVGVWQRAGDVTLVSYEGKAFSGRQIIEKGVDHLATLSYRKVVFIGASMGGLPAYFTMLGLRAREPMLSYRLVLIDAPTGWKDLQLDLQIFAPAAWFWWAGPVGNVVSRLYYGATYVKPKEENIEPGVDRKALDKHVEANMSHPVSWGMDQNRFLMSHPDIKPGSLDGVRVDFVRSTRDTDTVRKTFIESWIKATGVVDYQIHEVDSTHVGFPERPETWRKFFRQLFNVK